MALFLFAANYCCDGAVGYFLVSIIIPLDV